MNSFIHPLYLFYHLFPSLSFYSSSELVLFSPPFSFLLFTSFPFPSLFFSYSQQLVDFLSNMLNVHDESWQLGTTKIFIKSVMNEKLDRLLWVRYSSSSRRIQVRHFTVLCCIVLSCPVLSCPVLYYSVLCHTGLFYTILCYDVPNHFIML